MHSDNASPGLRLAAWGGLLFLHFPILIIVLYAFNTEDAAFSFPPRGLTLKWFGVAFSRPDVLECHQGFAALHGRDFHVERAQAAPAGAAAPVSITTAVATGST